VFSALVQHLESTYTMLSVSLNEAIELREEGRLAKSFQALGVTPALCARLAQPLGALLHGLGEHAKHYGTMANAAPLDPCNFQGSREQRTARMSDLLSRVLLTQRSQFLHKIAILEEMVEDLDKDFRATAEEIASGASVQPAAHWHRVDSAHYDLNTCLRESIVLLKSFLRALPVDQLVAFQKTVYTQMQVPELQTEPQPQARRMVRQRAATEP